MIGKPEDEWRKMLSISDGRDLPNHIEYQGLLMRKKQRRDLRKWLNWVVILVANFYCPSKMHEMQERNEIQLQKSYVSIEEWKIMLRIQRVTRLNDSLKRLLEEQQDELVKFWRIYQDISSQRSIKELRIEFLA